MRGALLSVVVVLVALACDEEFAPCYPGDFVGCACASGARGYAACTNETYGACVCDGVTPGLDAGRDATATCGGTKPLFDDCAANAECASCRCETFGTRGRCTVPCTSVAECPAPADVCTNRGVCRPPT